VNQALLNCAYDKDPRMINVFNLIVSMKLTISIMNSGVIMNHPSPNHVSMTVYAIDIYNNLVFDRGVVDSFL
jgi:hypothetical protein